MEENGQLNRYLNYTGSLSGFYNARYFFELVKHKRIPMDVGRYIGYMRQNIASNSNSSFVALLLQVPTVDAEYKYRLSLLEVEKVVDCLVELHKIDCSKWLSYSEQIAGPQAVEIVNNDNYVLVQGFHSVFLKEQVNVYLEDIIRQFPEAFEDIERIVDRACHLYKSFTSLDSVFRVDGGAKKVLCHGNLIPQNLRFDESGSVAQIESWEHVHFGDPVEDLVQVLVSALSPNDRRTHALSVLRNFYYKVVDAGRATFKLQDLKTSYLAYLKYAVFFNLSTLWQQTRDSTLTQRVKVELVGRWAALVDDAFDVDAGKVTVDLW